MSPIIHQQKVLVLDCQTTGMHPKNGHMLELAWSLFDPNCASESRIHSHLIKLPEGETIPPRIQELTGILDTDLVNAYTPNEVYQKLQATLFNEEDLPLTIAHYAQFEKSFLKNLYFQMTGHDTLNFELLCTQKIAKHLFPNLPSHNIKAVASYANCAYIEFKRATSHVLATIEIWKSILKYLSQHNIVNLASLNEKLSSKPKHKEKLFYSIERLTRLQLPNKPGIYRFLSLDNKVLYIGKATSLKARVNSYFTGQIKYDKKKLEMITQVKKIEFVKCDTALEAALLEVEEINQWYPPYNIILKGKNRTLLFYDKSFTHHSPTQTEIFFLGPFKIFDAIHQLCELQRWLAHGEIPNFFDEEALPYLDSAFQRICHLYDYEPNLIKQLSVRQLVCLGFGGLKTIKRDHSTSSIEKLFTQEKLMEEMQQASILERLTSRLKRIVIRAAYVKKRSRDLTRLLNCAVMINPPSRVLEFNHGSLDVSHHQFINKLPWVNLSIQELDRMSVLLSAITKNKYRVIYHSDQ